MALSRLPSQSTQPLRRSQAEIEREHLEAIAKPAFPTSLDHQQRVIEAVREARQRGAQRDDPFPKALLGAMALRIGETAERLWEITALSVPEVRRALKARRSVVADRLPHELLFPTDGWLGAYLDLTLLTEQPLAYHFWVGVTILGAALRRNLYMDLGFEDVLYPNHYIFLVGGTGLGKNQAIGVGARLIERANHHPTLKRWCLDWDQDRRVRVLNETTYEGLIDQVSPGKSELDNQFIQRIESVGLLINAEASTVIGKARKDLSDRLISGLTDWYDGKARETAARTAGTRRLGPLAFSMILGSNEQWITDNIGQSVISGGFTGRTLMVHRVERDRIRYRDIPAAHNFDPTIEAALADMMVPWMTMDAPCEAHWSAAAEVAWERWYIGHRESAPPSPRLDGWWQRKPAHVAKLAMVLLASQIAERDLDLTGVRSLEVPLELFEKALEILENEQHRIPLLLEHLDAHPDFSRVEWVFERLQGMSAKRKGEPVPHHEVAQSIRHKVPTATQQAEVFKTLVADGRVDVVLKGGSKFYTIKPNG